jgi:hypothetical protein
MIINSLNFVEGVGFEPTKAEPSDLQSDPFGRSGTPPKKQGGYCETALEVCQLLISDNSYYLIRKSISCEVSVLAIILYSDKNTTLQHSM